MLSADELSELRNEITFTLPDLCDVYRFGETLDDAGFSDQGFSLQVSNAGCRFDPLTKADSAGVIVQAESARTYYQVTLEHGTDVQQGDRLRFNSVDYDIVQLHKGHSINLVIRAIVARHD